MPVNLQTDLKRWLRNRQPQNLPNASRKTVKPSVGQLAIDFNPPSNKSRHQQRIKLSELLDAGLISPKMPVRVRLRREIADELGRIYINGMVVSRNGCVVYNEIEYERPSPLAMAVNQDRTANGWEYVEVKTRKGDWVRLEELRSLLNTYSTNKKHE
ncbi:MAG: hypothetical protein IM539_16855 [Pseudanabaena sp. M046S1SP1A06QC]|nr:hypothetical protein [Pseudanabaena sp. M046S1SP1A06QC]